MWEAPSFSVQIGPQKGCAEMKKSCLRLCTYTHIRSRSWRVSGRGLGRDRTAPAHLLHPGQGSAWAGVFVETTPAQSLGPPPKELLHGVLSKNTNELKTGAPGRFDRHRPMASPRSGACRRRCRRFEFP